MSETTNKGDKTLSVSAKKRISLKRTVESGLVRQNFSHGRSKSVLVEKKKRRLIGPSGQGEPARETAPAAEMAMAEAEPRQEPAAEAEAPRSGVVLRTLTDEEKDARAQALAEARVREAEERRHADEEAERRQERLERERRERELAAARAEQEEARLKAEEEARQRSEQEAKRRLAGEAPEPGAAAAAEVSSRELAARDEERSHKKAEAKPVRPPRGGERRRGRLTVSNALNEEERARSLASIRRQRERMRKQVHVFDPQQKVVREVVVPETISIQELANRMAVRAVDVIKLLMKQGQMLKITDVIDADTAQLVAEELGHQVRRVAESDVEEGILGEEDEAGDLQPRPPVVTVMGHVDHGKTSLLDAIRKTKVVAGEAGGITQHIGAYQVTTDKGDKITFIDTPGHEAFTAMRARGAKVTDIVILVVAADDGVMPQTVEAINHARAAGVPLIVAINKIDKTGADPSRVRTDLLQHEVVVESMSGDVLEVEVSALKGTNLDKLLDAVLLQAELLELKANPDRPASGVVVEAKLDKGRGPVATVLVQRGTLRVGDIVVAGPEWGKVRALVNDHGDNVEEAGPSVPVEILGLNAAPGAGDQLVVVETEGRAREIAEYRQRQRREKLSARAAGARGSLEQMMTQLKESGLQEIPLVVKADVQGSAEAIIGALDKLGTEEVAARVIHTGVGGITESDVTLAAASEAPIIGFNVRANKQAREAAERDGVEIRYYNVIYDLVDDVKAAMSGLLAPAIRETFLGNAEILEVFNISKVGKVAGCRVTEGKVERGASVRLIRDDVVIHEGKLGTLKRFKDEVKEVQAGQECGMGFENYHDIRQGDVIECFRVEEVERTL